MINVHLNGDIVRCPDIAAIHKRAQEIRDLHRICKYGYHENTCQSWLIAVRSHKYSGRCCLFGCEDCPGNARRKEIGNKKKSFKIDNQVYRKLASASHFLVKESKNKVLFLTLTFPKFKRKVPDNEINQYFSRYVENLRKNYNCGGYIAVRERGKENHRIHFHILLSIPFIPFAVLNRSWCNTISDICEFSKIALQFDKKALFIKNPTRAMKYVCKYFSKAKGQITDSRLVFLSNNILQKPKNIYEPVTTILKGFKSIYIQQTSDYTTCYRITDNKEFARFCEEFLYPLFELSVKKQEFLYAFPINSS